MNPSRFTVGFSELDNSQWVCDFNQYHTGSSNNLVIEFTSSTATPSYSGSYFGLGMFIQDNGVAYYNITTANNNGSRIEALFPSSGNLNSYKGIVLYGRLTRLSTTSFKGEVFTDSSRTLSLGSSTLTISADIQDLVRVTFWASGSGANNYVSDLKIWDGTTLTTGDPDYENNFSSSTGWTQSGSTINVNSAHANAVGSTSTTAGDYVLRSFS
tara:strand:- start:262 stop:900 length:639 start_codon:yes stop_codon:yes gene_type:complete